MSADLFRNVGADDARQQKFLKRPAAPLSYVIHFTPRSGSSWLTDIIAATGRLSAANEAFNPEFIPKIAHALGARDMDQYVDLLRRRFNTQGVYGVEVTAHQINAVFGVYDGFHHYFADAKSFWLIRKDIVNQAVSLAKMVMTDVAHTKGADANARQAADQKFAYSAPVIKRWLKHIHAAEIASEKWFKQFDLTPLRMSYEQTTQLGAHRMVNVIARHLGLDDIPEQPLGTKHGKLGTQQNTDYADRFREDEAVFLAEVDAQRASMIAKLDPIGALVADLR